MRKAIILALTLLSSFRLLAQKDIPSYGKIDKADMEMTDCPFDPGADAYILIKTGEMTYVINGGAWVQTVYRYRVKILKDAGVDEEAIVKIPFYSETRDEEINNIGGETYNLDASGNIVKSKLDKSNIYTKEITKGWSEVSFTLPDVKKGSIIEYKYTKFSRRFWDLDNFYFQEYNPVKYCQLYLSIPEYFDFTYHILPRTLPIDIQDNSIQEAVKIFTVHDVAGVRDEPYMSAKRDFEQHIEFQFSALKVPGEPVEDFRSSWPKLTDELLNDEDFGAQLHRNIPHTQALDAELSGLTDSAQRMKAIFDYVQSHMDWNGEDTRYATDGVKEAWAKKSGGTGDINLILINLLRDAKLRAYPLLVSTRDHGRINIFYPELDQFNETMAYVPIGEKDYVLNAADKYNPIRLIPSDVLYTRGFIVDKDNMGWLPLVSPGAKYRTVVILSGTMDDKGVLKGEAGVNNYDYSRNVRCSALKNDGLEKFKDDYFSQPNIKVDSFSVENADDDSLPLKQTVDFTSTLNSSGGYIFMNPNLFSGLEKNVFVAEHRFTDVDFGYQQSYTIVGTFEIPDGYAFETLPKNIRMIMQDTSIVLQRLMQQSDDTHVNFRITLDFKRPVYYTDEYPDFREFYKKLFENLNEVIVVKKKSA